MKIKLFLTLTLFTILLNTLANAQGLNVAKLDSLFDKLAEHDKAMGTVAISKNGRTVYKRSIGYSLISDQNKKSITENTKYRIGSVSKVFTATLIFQLIQEKKLKLTTVLSDYFPQFPNAEKITITNLLNHSSGLHNFTEDADYKTWMTSLKTQAEMLDILSKQKPDFEPGVKSSYSNTNYIILGYIVEKITQKTYAWNLEKRIISKLKLANTYCGSKINSNNDESFSYKYKDGWYSDLETDMSISGGAGMIVSNPTDLTQFIDALFELKLVSKYSLDQMMSIKNGYGMGLIQMPFYSKRAFGHNGSIDGFASTVAHFPEDNLSVAYCTNGQIYPLNDIMIGILSICFNKPYNIPTFSVFVLNAEDLDKYLGVYANPKAPLKITITKKDKTLFAQATGQSSFPLEATEKDKFKFDQAGIIMEFNVDTNELIFQQGGRKYSFMRE